MDKLAKFKIGLVFILLLSSLFFALNFVSSASPKKDVYFLGEKVKIDITSDKGCRIYILTPTSKHRLFASTGKVQITTKELGSHKIIVDRCRSSFEY